MPTKKTPPSSLSRKQLEVLRRSAQRHPRFDLFDGTCLNFEYGAGGTDALAWLLAYRLVRKHHGRYLATAHGRRFLNHLEGKRNGHKLNKRTV